MTETSKRDEHARLVLRMADRQGLDLQEMIVRAEFTEEQLDDAIDGCMGCTQPAACKCALDSAGPSLEVPEYCRNADLLSRGASE